MCGRSKKLGEMTVTINSHYNNPSIYFLPGVHTYNYIPHTQLEDSLVTRNCHIYTSAGNYSSRLDW